MTIRYVVSFDFSDPIEDCVDCPFAVEFLVDNFGVSEREDRCVFLNKDIPWREGKLEDCPLVSIEEV